MKKINKTDLCYILCLRVADNVEWNFRKDEDNLIKDHHYLIKRHTGKKRHCLLKIHEEELKHKQEMYNINKEVDLFMTDKEETKKKSIFFKRHFQKIRSIMERKCKVTKSRGCLIKRCKEEIGKQREICIISKEVQNVVPWVYVISDINGEEVVGTFYEKELHETNQT